MALTNSKTRALNQRRVVRALQGICEGIQGLLDPADVLPYSENLQATLNRKKEAAASEPTDMDDEEDGTPAPALGLTGGQWHLNRSTARLCTILHVHRGGAKATRPNDHRGRDRVLGHPWILALRGPV